MKLGLFFKLWPVILNVPWRTVNTVKVPYGTIHSPVPTDYTRKLTVGGDTEHRCIYADMIMA